MQWRMGPFRLDLDHACLWQGDERVVLRPKTFDLLVYLVEYAGELISKEELLAAIWPGTVVGNVGSGERQEPLAQGETPHLASRLHILAGTNELVVSGATRDLLG